MLFAPFVCCSSEYPQADKSSGGIKININIRSLFKSIINLKFDLKLKLNKLNKTIYTKINEK